jgi:hypothetical protein
MRFRSSCFRLALAVSVVVCPVLADEPGPGNDYGRPVIGGNNGIVPWQDLLQDEGFAGWRPRKGTEIVGWKRSGKTLTSGEGAQSLQIGDESWLDYEFSVYVTPIKGGNAMLGFRISDDKRYKYKLDFMLGWQAIAIYRADSTGGEKLSVVNFPVDHNREYHVQIAVRGASLTSYIDGKLVNQVTDHSLKSGAIGLSVWRSETAYREPRIRLLRTRPQETH